MMTTETPLPTLATPRTWRQGFLGQPVTVAGREHLQGHITLRVNANQTVNVQWLDGTVQAGIAYGDLIQLQPAPTDQIYVQKGEMREDAGIPLVTLIGDDQFVMEEKFDGQRELLAFHTTAPYRALSPVVAKNGRLGEDAAKLPQFAPLATLFDDATVIDGELQHATLRGQEGFQKMRGIMGSLPARAIAKQAEDGNVRMVAFDLLWLNGADLRALKWEERRALLEELVSMVNAVAPCAPLEIAPVARGSFQKAALLERVQAEGGEGTMAKYRSLPYGDTSKPGQRSGAVIKVKPFRDDDVVIFGVESKPGEITGKEYGVFRFAQFVALADLTPEMTSRVVTHALLMEIVEAGNAAGRVLVDMGAMSIGDWKLQDEVLSAPDAWIGKVAVVKFQLRWAGTGQMRHPNLVRFRDDKPATECEYRPGSQEQGK